MIDENILIIIYFIKHHGLSRPIEGGVASLSSNFVNFAYVSNVPINTSVVWDRFVQVYAQPPVAVR